MRPFAPSSNPAGDGAQVASLPSRPVCRRPHTSVTGQVGVVVVSILQTLLWSAASGLLGPLRTVTRRLRGGKLVPTALDAELMILNCQGSGQSKKRRLQTALPGKAAPVSLFGVTDQLECGPDRAQISQVSEITFWYFVRLPGRAAAPK